MLYTERIQSGGLGRRRRNAAQWRVCRHEGGLVARQARRQALRPSSLITGDALIWTRTRRLFPSAADSRHRIDRLLRAPRARTAGYAGSVAASSCACTACARARRRKIALDLATALELCCTVKGGNDCAARAALTVPLRGCPAAVIGAPPRPCSACLWAFLFGDAELNDARSCGAQLPGCCVAPMPCPPQVAAHAAEWREES